MQVDKLIVTNTSALKKKYGDGYERIEYALDELVRADATRGVTTLVVALDETSDVLDSSHAVARADSALQAKVAIDRAFEYYKPHYLVILGGVDIVPQQPLRNPDHSPDDSSKTVPSDLPYACETGRYSLDVRHFTGPTRVIGRLPEVTGYSNPAYLEGLLGTAAAAVSHDAPTGNHVFALCAKKWIGQTTGSLALPYPGANSGPSVLTSPTRGPDWAVGDLKGPLHFINCHGGWSDCRFYGDAGGRPKEGVDDPIAHASACIAGRLTDGTVAVTECCFGAQLYDPALTGGVPGICTTYLANGAYAFVGSSGVAYGGVDGVESADVLCGLLMKYLLSGASSGNAFLSALQEFVHLCRPPLDPVDLKTIAQFSLMGDPSIHPFLPAGTTAPAEAAVPAEGPPSLHLAAKRAERRAGLAKRGEELRRLTATAGLPIEIPDSHKTISDILRFAGVKDWGVPDLRSFDVTPAEQPPDDVPGPHALIHVITRPDSGRQRPFPVIELIIATEVDGKIVACRRVSSR